MRIAVLILATCLPIGAMAQSVVNADVATLQPQIARDAKGFTSCGMRALVLVGGIDKGHTYDFSIVAYAQMFSGLIKAGKYINASLQPNSRTAVKAMLPGPVNFWFAAADQGIPLAPTKILPAESAGFILGGVEIVPAVTAILDMVNGKQVQFALRYRDQRVDQVISFASKPSQTDFDAILACFTGLQTRMKVEDAAATDGSNGK